MNRREFLLTTAIGLATAKWEAMHPMATGAVRTFGTEGALDFLISGRVTTQHIGPISLYGFPTDCPTNYMSSFERFATRLWIGRSTVKGEMLFIGHLGLGDAFGGRLPKDVGLAFVTDRDYPIESVIYANEITGEAVDAIMRMEILPPREL